MMWSLVAAIEDGLGPEFAAIVDRMADVLDPGEQSCVLFDEQPDRDPAVRLARVAVLAALRRTGKVEVAALGARYHMWRDPMLLLPVGTRGPGVPLADQVREWTDRDGSPDAVWFVTGTPLPRRRTVVIEKAERAVRVSVNGVEVEVPVPSDEMCERILGGVGGTSVRFPVFSPVTGALLARGDAPDELMVLRVGCQAVRCRLPGPVLAASYVDGAEGDSLVALIQDGDRLRVHVEGHPFRHFEKMSARIDFDVTDDALSPLYMQLDWGALSLVFRRAGEWWRFHYNMYETVIFPLDVAVAAPGLVDTDVSFGAEGTIFGPRTISGGSADGIVWTIYDHSVDGDVAIAVEPREQVLGLTKIDSTHFLVVRDGNLVRRRSSESVSTVTETEGSVLIHGQLPWLAIQRSPRRIEVMDIGSGGVLDELCV